MSRSEAFRTDIQGLRGIAIALVVLEHTTPFFQGGYVGVDVFFVLSGYLITQILLRDMQENRSVSLVEFYSRRARRLLPALTVVLVATLFISIFTLSPGLEQEKTVLAAFSSFFFIANIYYMFQGGYFFLQSDPLRHLWSLGVEEQFYLVYPVLIILVFRFSKILKVSSRKLLFMALLAISLVSFAISSLLSLGLTSVPLQSRLAFFGTPFRLWELLAGGLLATLQPQISHLIGRSWSFLARVIGLLLIFWPAFTYDQFTIFPGFSALPPVLGAVLIILAGIGRPHSRSLLTVKPLTFLGDISYGLYLWHWPLFVFAERMYPSNQLAVISAVVLSLCLSMLQLKFVEDPIRQQSAIIGRKAVLFWFKSLSGVLVFCILLFGLSQTGLGVNRSPQFETIQRLSEPCGFVTGYADLPLGCKSGGDAEQRILLIGDSQAAALGDGLAVVARELKISFGMVYSNSCPIHARPNELRDSCEEFLSYLPSLIESFDPSLIVVANASDLYVSRGGYGKPDTKIRTADGRFPTNYKESLNNWTSGLKEVLTNSTFALRPIVYVQMIPVAPVHGASLFTGGAVVSSFALSDGFDRNLIALEERATLAAFTDIKILDPAEVLCPNAECLLRINGEAIYSDEFHLNNRGARLLASGLKSLIQSSLNL